MAVYGTAPNQWDAYAFAGPGQTAPSFTPMDTALSISGSLHAATPTSYIGLGLSFDGAGCVNAGNYGGITFNVSGSLGTCSLVLAAIVSEDESASKDPCRGTCAGATNCTAPTQPVTHTGMFTAVFMSFVGGSPVYAADTTQLIGFQWRLEPGAEDAGGDCSADIQISDIQFIQ
jgi:hypothetical protein